MRDGNKWGDAFVRWREFVTIMISMIVAGSCLFGYVLNMHAAQPHETAVSHKEILAVEQRLDRLEERHVESMRRIEEKLDKALSN